MTDRPIIFSAPMVRALLDGRKSQTRRIIRPRNHHTNLQCTGSGEWWWWTPGTGSPHVREPLRFAIGDRLWVRETWRSQSMRPDDVIYRADGESLMSWRSPIHMPRWASRLTLTVTDVRVQRVRDISEDDAKAEGIGSFEFAFASDRRQHRPDVRFSDAFADLWNSIHGPDAWDANPWVAAVSFTARRGNIDA